MKSEFLDKIEKCAGLLGYKNDGVVSSGVWLIDHKKPLNRDKEHPIRLFNPYEQKEDALELQCELGIDVSWHEEDGYVEVKHKEMKNCEELSKHNTKMDALCYAIVELVCMMAE